MLHHYGTLLTIITVVVVILIWIIYNFNKIQKMRHEVVELEKKFKDSDTINKIIEKTAKLGYKIVLVRKDYYYEAYKLRDIPHDEYDVYLKEYDVYLKDGDKIIQTNGLSNISEADIETYRLMVDIQNNLSVIKNFNERFEKR